MIPVDLVVLLFLWPPAENPLHLDRLVVSAVLGWGIKAKSITGDLCGVRLAMAAFLVVGRFLRRRLNEPGDPDGYPISAVPAE